MCRSIESGKETESCRNATSLSRPELLKAWSTGFYSLVLKPNDGCSYSSKETILAIKEQFGEIHDAPFTERQTFSCGSHAISTREDSILSSLDTNQTGVISNHIKRPQRWVESVVHF